MAKKKEEKQKRSSALSSILLASSLVILVAIAGTIVRSHILDKMQTANTYYGDPSDFEKPVCVVYQELVETTPEHQELTRLLSEEGIDRNDPEARILMADAAERVTNAIEKFAKANEYDLVCEAAYWEKYAPRDVVAGDVTDRVIEVIRGEQ